MSTEIKLPKPILRLRSRGIILGPMALVLAVLVSVSVGGLERFFHAYLFAFIVWLALGTGSLAVLMVHHMTGGAWSFVTQRILEASTRTLPLLALLFVPILIGPLTGIHGLYDGWVNPESHVVELKSGYLNPEFWTVRAIGYFALWSFIAFIFSGWSRRLETTGNGLIVLNFQRAAPIGLILYCLSMTLAATDWVMSLEPDYYSTIWGPLFWVSQALTVLAFSTIVLSYLADQAPLNRFMTANYYHHLGNMMMGFVVLWAYMSFSQYLIIWSGNLPEETHWYLVRRGGGLTGLSLCLMAFHFFVPLMLLLFRRHKLNIVILRRICYWILFWRLADLFWTINPSFHHADPGIHALDLLLHALAVIGIGGIWLWAFVGQLKKYELLPLNDPRLYDAVSDKGEAVEHA